MTLSEFNHELVGRDYTIAHHDDASAFTNVPAHFGDDGTKDLFRRLLEDALQDLIDTEVTTKIGAGLHERTDARSNFRNGNPRP